MAAAGASGGAQREEEFGAGGEAERVGDLVGREGDGEAGVAEVELASVAEPGDGGVVGELAESGVEGVEGGRRERQEGGAEPDVERAAAGAAMDGAAVGLEDEGAVLVRGAAVAGHDAGGEGQRLRVVLSRGKNGDRKPIAQVGIARIAGRRGGRSRAAPLMFLSREYHLGVSFRVALPRLPADSRQMADPRSSLLAESDGIRLVAYRHAPGCVFEAHRHDTPHLCLATRGRWCEHCHGTSALVEPGTVVLHHAGAEHAGITGAEESRCVHLEFDASWVARFAPWRGAGAPSRIAHDPVARSLAAAIAREVAAHDAFSAAGAAALLGELLPRLHGAAAADGVARAGARRRDRLVPDAMRLLRARHREPVTVRDVADALDTDSATLVRAVRRTLGLTPGEVVRRHRARTALTLLAADRGRGALSRIAADAGFADQSHMTRTLRRLHGITPATAQRLGAADAPT